MSSYFTTGIHPPNLEHNGEGKVYFASYCSPAQPRFILYLCGVAGMVYFSCVPGFTLPDCRAA